MGFRGEGVGREGWGDEEGFGGCRREEEGWCGWRKGEVAPRPFFKIFLFLIFLIYNI